MAKNFNGSCLDEALISSNNRIKSRASVHLAAGIK